MGAQPKFVDWFVSRLLQAEDKAFSQTVLTVARDEALHALHLRNVAKSEASAHRAKVMHFRMQNGIGVSLTQAWMKDNFRIALVPSLTHGKDCAAEMRKDVLAGRLRH